MHWLEPIAISPTSPPLNIELGPGHLGIHTPIHETLTALKNDIDHVAPVAYWDDVKKITNPFEYIFLSLQRRMHRSISAVAPLSRSYFKMIEMWDVLNLSTLFAGRRIATAHAAEGPGGFLEAIQDRTDHETPMLAMTLKSTERTVPGWRKSSAFLTRHPRVLITYGSDNTGNLYSLANQAVFAAAAPLHLGSKADLFTADGGFDFSADFNGQENTVQRLLAAEALAGIQVLKPGGIMILKIFDTKNIGTLDLLWLISMCFERTGLIKPHTSRPANSERYWIGSGLHPVIPDWITELLSVLTSTDAPIGWNQIFRNPVWDQRWRLGIQSFQETVEMNQFHSIQLTLNIIRTPQKSQIADLLLINIQNSRNWCTRHRISENRQYAALSNEQVAAVNLEEALEPFRALVAQKSSRVSSLPPPTPREPTAAPTQRPQAGPAWRSALPPSIRGRSASQTSADTPVPNETAPAESHEVLAHVPALPENL